LAKRLGVVHDDIVLVEIVEEQVRDATEVEDDEQE